MEWNNDHYRVGRIGYRGDRKKLGKEEPKHRK
jgi:hypothetical protein